MTRDLQLRFLKALVNVPLRLLDRLLPEPQGAEYPQTKMILHMFKRLEQAYKLDAHQGTFGGKPDGNFERFLRTSKKLLSWISEDDRYYRAWVGLAFILAGEEMDWFNEEAPEVKRLIKEQWCLDLSFLPDAVVAENKREFLEVALCDYLASLARKGLED